MDVVVFLWEIPKGKVGHRAAGNHNFFPHLNPSHGCCQDVWDSITPRCHTWYSSSVILFSTVGQRVEHHEA